MSSTAKTVRSGLFVAIGVLLPRLIHSIPKGGAILCPMHIPVFLAGMTLGPLFGCIVGIITPLLSAVIFGSPVLFTSGICMAFELATYGVLSGILVKAIRFSFFKSEKNNVIMNTVTALVISMLSGRLVNGILNAVLLGSEYSFSAFITASFVTSLPAIVIQLLLVPALYVPFALTIKEDKNDRLD